MKTGRRESAPRLHATDLPVAGVEVVPLVAGTAPIVVRGPVVGLVVRVLRLLVVEAGGLLVVTSLGVEGRSLLSAQTKQSASEPRASTVLNHICPPVRNSRLRSLCPDDMQQYSHSAVLLREKSNSCFRALSPVSSKQNTQARLLVRLHTLRAATRTTGRGT